MSIRMKKVIVHTFDLLLTQENSHHVTHKCHKYTVTDAASSSHNSSADEQEGGAL